MTIPLNQLHWFVVSQDTLTEPERHQNSGAQCWGFAIILFGFRFVFRHFFRYGYGFGYGLLKIIFCPEVFLNCASHRFHMCFETCT
jgi:hypothetical protein